MSEDKNKNTGTTVAAAGTIGSASADGAGDPVAYLISDILACYYSLSNLPTLDPSPPVDALFGQLVHLCRQTPSDAATARVLNDPRIVEITPHLRQLCADGEYRLEAYWVEKLTRFETQEDVNAMLLSFPYYDNYVDLVRMELNAIASVTLDQLPSKFAVLGSGPLPLTSLCILQALKQQNPPVSVHNVDHDPWAISTSTELCRKLGHNAASMNFHCADAKSKMLDLYDFDVVYLAALVGIDNEQKKAAILEIVSHMRPGALLMLRSAHSLRGLLYPVVELTDEMATCGLKPLLVVHPYNHIVNSIIVARVDFPSPCRL